MERLVLREYLLLYLDVLRHGRLQERLVQVRLVREHAVAGRSVAGHAVGRVRRSAQTCDGKIKTHVELPPPPLGDSSSTGSYCSRRRRRRRQRRRRRIKKKKREKTENRTKKNKTNNNETVAKTSENFVSIVPSRAVRRRRSASARRMAGNGPKKSDHASRAADVTHAHTHARVYVDPSSCELSQTLFVFVGFVFGFKTVLTRPRRR